MLGDRLQGICITNRDIHYQNSHRHFGYLSLKCVNDNTQHQNTHAKTQNKTYSTHGIVHTFKMANKQKSRSVVLNWFYFRTIIFFAMHYYIVSLHFSLFHPPAVCLTHRL